ncbi:receptor-like protein EIX1 [Hibiscus syriacus]|uniref:receptor-like protein EIX1 n=1 Tax=Hibiscus syriacus TaxID=106335 RepID=UPI0019239D4C|nr:receptor-like protein EIX1 [Hibiscus syriacus]
MTILTISLFSFLLLIASICLCFCNGDSNVLCIESERDALLKFKNDLIDPSNSLSSWVEGGDCCDWNGVVCHNSTAHVTQLLLAPPDGRQGYGRSALGGKINPSLLELQHLNWLDLSNNNFSTIQIPKFLGLLGSLTYLNLSQTRFQGAIPRNLGNFSELQYLDLGRNYFSKYLDLSGVHLRKATDWLQVTLSNLPSLLELHLSDCMLQDDTSPISTVNSTNSLAVLDLSWNELSSVLMSIFGLHGLVSIDLSYNSLEGPIPDYFGNMSFLEVVDSSFNSLNSSIPNSLYSLNHLQSLTLSFNDLQGEISSAIGNLSSLIHLDLSFNELQGKVPDSLGDLCKLKEMDLSSNGIDQDISQILLILSTCCLDSLESLRMSYNQLSGHLTDQLGQFKNLAYMDLARNNISGLIPWSIGELSFLKAFDVSENQLNGISDVVPTWFLNLSTQFENVNLSSNQLTGRITYLNVGNIVDLCSNRFFGPLPRLLSNRFSGPLEYLSLSRSLFSGSLYEFVCNSSMTSMKVLLIDTNFLSGGIPDCWNLGQELKFLNLGNNNLTGKIPSSLGDKSLEMLNLRNNSMLGELPSTLQNCTNLVVLDLSKNHFSGRIPAWIGDKLSKLVELFQNVLDI